MSDSRTRNQAAIPNATEAEENAAFREQLGTLLKRLAERDEHVAKRDRLLFVQHEEITLLRNEVESLENHPRRPDVKPSGMSASAEAASPKRERRSKCGRGAAPHVAGDVPARSQRIACFR